MTFTENSGLVKTWVKYIRLGEKTVDNVPNIYNLREVVASIIEADKTKKA
jgi:hypothetical protein